MIGWVLAFSIRRRWYVLLFTIAAALSGAWALTVLPIDAVPDITNVQVQVNAFAPALSPLEVEKQVTFPIEVALAGTPGLEKTWSFSRNGFAQVTAVFSDRTDIYFARQQVTERLADAKNALPPGVEVKMGPISTGLGEVDLVDGRIRAGRRECARRCVRLAKRWLLSDSRRGAPQR